ncbi:MAG TPA: DUF1559 domain-containing protein [Planctomycetaceae bacterium]|jgi:hypothetical protein|nr:DUF1559 domain-containing protein [Planctomycetaceae bacterium]
MDSIAARSFVCGDRRHATVLSHWAAPTLIAGFLLALPCVTSAQVAAQPASRKSPWTLEEARTQLRLYPRDAYLQYVVLLLEKQNGGGGDPGDEAMQSAAARSPGRGTGVDLFSLFSGSSAVQESLQLDTMRGGTTPEQPARRRRMPRTNRNTKGGVPPVAEPAEPEPAAPPKSVRVSSLAGPTIQSHPWVKMLKGRNPQISPLAKSVPADFYFVDFHSLTKLIDAIETSDLWGQHLFSQTWQEARTQLFAWRIHQQLAVEISPVMRPFYDGVVSEVAVTGSDLYAREGSDVTLLFRFRQPELFHARMDSFLSNAEKSNTNARRTEGEYQGVRYIEVSTPDRSVHVFSAYPEPTLHVRSNSRMALNRVIDAIRGKDPAGQAVTRLGDTPEFAYIRTLMPEGAPEEDGFVYLSDPFIRSLVGPQLKLTERRRMICYNHLRMIGHAALFHLTQHGKKAGSLAELAESHSTPGEFGKGRLACPDGGTYTLAPDGLTAVCSHHGDAHALVPCCEIPLTEVTGDEADQYKAFLDNYNQYWRTYFDPIALRIQVRPERYRIETIVLPLIDNSVYTALAQATSGPPSLLDALPVPKRNIFSVAVRLNKMAVAKLLGVETLLDIPESREAAAAVEAEQAVNNLRQLGFAWHNYHGANQAFPTSEPRSKMPANAPRSGLSWRVHLLASMGYNDLASQFHKSEPWDSPHNKALIDKMPPIYRPSDAKFAEQGKTRFVAPLGDKLISHKNGRSARIREITDGTSNTIMLVEADDQHAVIWTKPDDLDVDLNKPMAGLAIRPPGGYIVLMADGAVKFLRAGIQPGTLAALFTCASGEPVTLAPNDSLALPHQPTGGRLFGSDDNFIRQLGIGEFITKGIGDEIGLHLYDADPLFDFSLPSAIGQSLGSFNGPGGGGFFDGNFMLLIGVVVAALQSPIYVSVPVHDAKVVDDFLDRLDRQLAALARQNESVGGFLQFSQDFYRLRQSGFPIRTYAFQIGPIKWRFFWARIGGGLYIASKPYILEEIAALNSVHQSPSRGNAEQPAHAMVRIRATHWNRVIPSYRLGWAENNRVACLHNLGPVSSLARAVVSPADRQPRADLPKEVRELGAAIYDTHFYCPEAGHYVFDADGSVACSIHGSALAPRQFDAPSPKSSLGRLLDTFADMTVLLTFREEGLHAVVTIDRKRAR